jgi:acetoin utilization protein AcuB
MKDGRISQHMVRYPHIIPPDFGLKDGLDMMHELGIRHLPVVQNEKLVGLVSERDIKAAVTLPQAKTLSVADIMKRDVFVVTSDTALSEVASEMADNKLGSAIIVDSKRNVVGIFTTTDALRLLADLAEEGNIEEYMIDYESYDDTLLSAGHMRSEW